MARVHFSKLRRASLSARATHRPRDVAAAGALALLATVAPLQSRAADLPDATPGGFVTPGYTWHRLSYPSSMTSAERRDLKAEGAVQQAFGVALTSRLAAELFGQVAYKLDSKHLDYNNKVTPELGARLRWVPVRGLTLEAGGRAGVERRLETDRTLGGATAYAAWSGYRQVDLDAGAGGSWPRPFSLALSGWSELRYPSARIGIERSDLLFEGALRLDLDWIRFGERAVLASRGEVEYTVDSRRLDYNNKLIPSAGVVLKVPTGGFGRFEVGARYEFDYRWTIDAGRSGASAFVSWSANWATLSHLADARM